MACLCVLRGGPYYAVGAESLIIAGAGDGAAGSRLSVDSSWLNTSGFNGGVARTGGSLVSARFVTPVGGTFGSDGVVDAAGAVAPHVVIEPEGATAPAWETDGGDVAGGGRGEPAGGEDSATGQPDSGPSTDHVVKPAASTLKTTTTTAAKTTVTKIAAPMSSKPKYESGLFTLYFLSQAKTQVRIT